MDDARIITDRQGLEVLSNEECWKLVGESRVGRVAFVDAGDPVILPVNHVLVGKTVAFLTAPGSKLHAAGMAKPVGFEVDGHDDASHQGWSVIIRGRAERVYDEDEIAKLAEAGLTPWATETDRNDWVEIRVHEISGRRII
ncbi:MAG: pyridoxamine 5'-phosphate oxidase family protein [Acidimicrobiia bacterium]|nr:pyridoxamine 5'-phosphate oxidase family protein [Acidimicrobiia bacterium]